jgi:hypothetical protein
MSDAAEIAEEAHMHANLCAKALVEALTGVGEKGRIVSPRGLALVTDVRSHGPLVVIDGVTEGGEAYRWAGHYSQVSQFTVLTERLPGEGAGAGDDG